MSIGRIARDCAFIGLLASPARANVCLVGVDGTAVERAVVVETIAGGARFAWLTVETRNAGRLAWLFDGRSAIEPRGSSFVDSLDIATTPAVVPPAISPYECSFVPKPSTPRRIVVDALGASETTDVFTLEEQLARFGARPEDCELELPVRLIEFEMPQQPAATSVVRLSSRQDAVLGPSGAALSTLRASFRVDATFLTFGPGGAHSVSMPESTARQLDLTYFLATRTGDYSSALAAQLDRVPGSSTVREAVVPLIRSGTTDGERFPLFADYYARSAPGMAATCLARVRVSSQQYSERSFSLACPPEGPAASGWPPPPECEEVTSVGFLQPDLLRCGDADDFAFALSGLALSSARVTRSTVRLEPGAARQLEFESGLPEEPELGPSRIDSSGCRPGGSRPPDRSNPAVNPPSDNPIYVDTDTPIVAVEVVSSEGACSGDSSSTSEDDSCSGDSSSTSEDDSCSGDSSSTSEDDSCSGDSSSTSEDESCFGGAEASDDRRPDRRREATAEDDLRRASISSLGKSRRHRTRLSVWTLAMSGLWLPIRRRFRPRDTQRVSS